MNHQNSSQFDYKSSSTGAKNSLVLVMQYIYSYYIRAYRPLVFYKYLKVLRWWSIEIFLDFCSKKSPKVDFQGKKQWFIQILLQCCTLKKPQSFIECWSFNSADTVVAQLPKHTCFDAKYILQRTVVQSEYSTNLVLLKLLMSEKYVVTKVTSLLSHK